MSVAEFDRLRTATQRKLYAYLGKRMRPDDVEDMAAAVYVRAWERRAQFRAGSPFEPWLLRIARNMMVDAARAARVRPLPLSLIDCQLEYTQSLHADPVACVERAQLSERMQRALNGLLPERQRAVVLFHLQDLSYEEVAEREGVCVGTVRSRLSRARAALRRQYAE